MVYKERCLFISNKTGSHPILNYKEYKMSEAETKQFEEAVATAVQKALAAQKEPVQPASVQEEESGWGFWSYAAVAIGAVAAGAGGYLLYDYLSTGEHPDSPE